MRGVGVWGAIPLILAAALTAGCAGSAEEPVPTDGSFQPPEIEAGKGAIAGLLIDDIYRPVPGGFVLVEGLGLTATTDASGQFWFVDLEPGAYVLLVNADRHEAAPLPVDVTEGEYAEVEVPARRLFSDDGAIITTRYSVFINCAVSAVVVTGLLTCLPDSSGDSNRDRFSFTDDPYGNASTALVLEMQASQPDGYAVQLYCEDTNKGSSWTEDEGDYVKVRWVRSSLAAYADQEGFEPWPDRCHELVARLWYLGSDVGGVRQGGLSSWGTGARIAIKATFMLSVFVGEPREDLLSYHILSSQQG